MASASDERFRGRPGVNISDGPKGATTPVSKALAPVENISGIRGVGWRQFGRPQCLLEKSG